MICETKCQNIFFLSSSGHCTLDCRYCIVEPIAKKEKSLTYEDVKYLIDLFPGKCFLSFSGKGDFFAGYGKNDNFLGNLLKEDVEIALDVNGILIQDFPQLTEKQLAKIRFMNLTLHYHQVKMKGLQEVWGKNAKIIIEKKGTDLLLGTVMSPPLQALWEEALDFYYHNVFLDTGKKIVLIKDIQQKFDQQANVKLEQCRDKYSGAVERIHEENFPDQIGLKGKVVCPAGKSYFRIWNDGTVQGCPHIPDLKICGNIKERTMILNADYYHCSQAKHCDCHIIAALGMMGKSE